MLLRLVILFSVVCLASCETNTNSEDPPLLEALNAKYFGHIRGKRMVSLKTNSGLGLIVDKVLSWTYFFTPRVSSVN